MPENKGGRGNKAPYETTHVRIPVPIKEIVEKISADYKEGKPVVQVDAIPSDQAIEEAKRIMKSKRSAKISMQNLLTAIYGIDVEL